MSSRGDGGATRRITSFDADGFSVGTGSRVNTDGKTYHYAAWNLVSGKMNVGSYVGNDVDNRYIGGVGFQPEYVILRKGQQCNDAAHKPASTGANTDNSLDFRDSQNDSNEIQALKPDGFEVGGLEYGKSNTQVNGDGITYYWMAFASGGGAGLAVDLSRFTTVGLNGKIRIDWSTESEVETACFNILRSI